MTPPQDTELCAKDPDTSTHCRRTSSRPPLPCRWGHSGRRRSPQGPSAAHPARRAWDGGRGPRCPARHGPGSPQTLSKHSLNRTEEENRLLCPAQPRAPGSTAAAPPAPSSGHAVCASNCGTRGTHPESWGRHRAGPRRRGSRQHPATGHRGDGAARRHGLGLRPPAPRVPSLPPGGAAPCPGCFRAEDETKQDPRLADARGLARAAGEA